MSILKASFFEKLVQLLRVHLHVDIHDLIHITQIHYHNNPTAPIFQQQDPQKISLNIGRILSELPPIEREEFKKLIAEAVVQDGIPLLEENSKKRVEDIELKESDRDTIALLNFFRGKMPPDDFTALRGAIYINKRWDEGAPYEEIHALKGELMAKYGNRGRKINNLLSSGYFEETIMPLYNEMAKYPNFTGAAFLERYNLIVDEEAFALFVNSRMMADALPTMIHSKIRRNLKYGVNYVTIHGLGKENVEHVKEILMDVEVNYSILRKEIEETGFWIKVKYWFDKSKTKSL